MNNLSSRRIRACKNKPAPDLLRSRFICLITTMWQRRCTDCRFYRGGHAGRIIQCKYFRRRLSRAPRIPNDRIIPRRPKRSSLFTVELNRPRSLRNSRNRMMKRYRRTALSTTRIYRRCKWRSHSAQVSHCSIWEIDKCRCQERRCHSSWCS